ncbi:MAG: hypothetical protein ACD_3C00001G0002 [uncultured bacterium (gcode 4)]|uniref:Uncharacterized protein n=1 Tax=uncultured bacterium (gcode 4) TaxID=1234023 RepID=K2FCP1_9BACT|nr:MAG: hypothetical protein ACD_3C00001G0002 [uncultured bacterium (gcode 4)]
MAEKLSPINLLSTINESIHDLPVVKKEKLSKELIWQCDIWWAFDKNICKQLIEVIQLELPKNNKNYLKLREYYNSIDLVASQEVISTNAMISDFSYIDLKKIKLVNWDMDLSALKPDEQELIKELLSKWFDIKKAVNNQFGTSKSKSWFSWVLLENSKSWEKFFAIRWTDEWFWKDVNAILSLIFWKPPVWQITDMQKFFNEKNNWNDIQIVWHSLWWCISQILATIEKWYVGNVFTYNAPWVEKIYKKMHDMRLNHISFNDLWLIDPWQEFPKLAEYIDEKYAFIQKVDYKINEYWNIFNFIWKEWAKIASSEFIFWKRLWYEFKVENSSWHWAKVITDDIKKASLKSFMNFNEIEKWGWAEEKYII